MTELICVDCGIPAWALGEDFHVLDGLWHLTMPRRLWGSIVCVGCFEDRLGRQLTRKDFKRWFRENRWFANKNRLLNDPISPRLANRLWWTKN